MNCVSIELCSEAKYIGSDEQSKAKVMCHKLMGNVQFVYFRKRISILRSFYFSLLTYFGLFFYDDLLLFYFSFFVTVQ